MIKTFAAAVLLVGTTAYGLAAEQQHVVAPEQPHAAAQVQHHTMLRQPYMAEPHGMVRHGRAYWDANHVWRGGWSRGGHWTRCPAGPYRHCYVW